MDYPTVCATHDMYLTLTFMSFFMLIAVPFGGGLLGTYFIQERQSFINEKAFLKTGIYTIFSTIMITFFVATLLIVFTFQSSYYGALRNDMKQQNQSQPTSK